MSISIECNAVIKHPIVEPEPLPQKTEVFCDEVEEEKQNADKLKEEISKVSIFIEWSSKQKCTET